MAFHAARLHRPLALGVCAALALGFPAAASEAPALAAFASAIANLQDYTVTIRSHEVQGDRVQDRVQQFWFKKPLLAKVEVTGGPGRGGFAVWHGGSTLRGHEGGLFSFVKLTLDIHDARAESLRGDTIDTAYFGQKLDHFQTTKGELSESPGPLIEGMPTEAVTLDVADPAADHAVSREVLYLSNATHLPVKAERFEGPLLVKSETFIDFKANVGLTDADFDF
jgi:outer membrane lipoprotein-sorting protein